MRTRPQNPVILIIVIALAVALTFIASGGALARSMFQSSILPSPGVTATIPSLPTATPTFIPNLIPTDVSSIVQTPVIAGVTLTATLPVETVPTLIDASNATPTASGFLPPPTLVNPNAVAPDRLTPLAPANLPLVGPAAPPEPTPTPAQPDMPGAAELIDSGVVALSYLWLCCGALILIAAGLVALWLWRRSKHSEPRNDPPPA